MKISYKILWIDDEPNQIEEDRKNIEEFLEEFGIRADILIITNSKDKSIPKLIGEPELDILLVDFRMDGKDGAELVEEIRNSHHVYLPVIFYSSSDLEVILEAASEAKLDGVYLAQRDYLTQKFKNVAKSLLNKEHTTKRTRGLLMEEVSEIDARFKEIYTHIWERISVKDQEKLIKYLKKIIEKRAQSTREKWENFPDELEEFSDHMGNHFLSKHYDTYTRWRVVGEMLEYLDDDLGDSREILKEFVSRRGGDSLNNLRNTYAHTTRQELQESHSEEKCVEIRQEIHRQQDNIDRIVENVVSQKKRATE